MTKPTEDLIRTRAHALWELAGKPEGREKEFWREAEREFSADPADPAVNAEESSHTFTE